MAVFFQSLFENGDDDDDSSDTIMPSDLAIFMRIARARVREEQTFIGLKNVRDFFSNS